MVLLVVASSRAVWDCSVAIWPFCSVSSPTRLSSAVLPLVTLNMNGAALAYGSVDSVIVPFTATSALIVAFMAATLALVVAIWPSSTRSSPTRLSSAVLPLVTLNMKGAGLVYGSVDSVVVPLAATSALMVAFMAATLALVVAIWPSSTSSSPTILSSALCACDTLYMKKAGLVYGSDASVTLGVVPLFMNAFRMVIELLTYAAYAHSEKGLPGAQSRKTAPAAVSTYSGPSGFSTAAVRAPICP